MRLLKRMRNALLKLINDPVYFYLRLLYEVRPIFSSSPSRIKKKINGVSFEFDFNNSPFALSSYLGDYEIAVRKVMETTLRPGDTFIDVGANIGYLSAIGAGLVSTTGQVHSFEPVPGYFLNLKKLTAINPHYKIIANQCALGETEGIFQMDVANFKDASNNTLVPNFMKPETIKENINIRVRRLDNYIKEHDLKNITLIKIDVEGFEFPVLKGMRDFFGHTPNRPAILCEIGTAVCSLMGYNLKDLFDYMKGFGYASFDLNNKRIEWSDMKKMENILFIPSGD